MALTKRTYVDGETIITAQNLNDIQDEIIAHESNKVPITRTVNSKALSSNITLTAADVSAVPTTRTVNGKSLSSNATIKASDIPNDSTIDGTNVDDALDNLSGAINGLEAYIKDKKIAIFGDSWSDEDIQWSSTVNDVWVKTFRTLCQPYGATISNYSRSSRGWCIKDNNNQYTGVEAILNTSLTNIDTVILFLGLNDFLNGVWTSNCWETQDTLKLWGALHAVESAITGKNVFVVTLPCVSATGNKIPSTTAELYRIVLANWAKSNGFMLINGSSFPHIGYGSSAFSSDNAHILNAYHPYVAEYIFNKIVNGGEAFSPFIEIAYYTPSASPSNGSFNTCAVKYNQSTIELLIQGNITDITSNFDASDLDAPSISVFTPRMFSISLYNRALLTAYVGDDNTTPKGQLYVARPSFVSDTGADGFAWTGIGYSSVLGGT